jgi:hypothetical protein
MLVMLAVASRQVDVGRPHKLDLRQCRGRSASGMSRVERP